MPETPSAAVIATTPSTSVAGTSNGRPSFLDDIGHAYSDKGKSIVVVTGDTHGLFFCPKVADGGRYLDLEPTIYQEWSAKFHALRLDIASGLEVYDDDEIVALQKAVALADSGKTEKGEKFGEVRKALKATLHDPLPALEVMRKLMESVTLAREGKNGTSDIKKLLVVVQFAGSLFPAGDFDKLNELDRQRLVTFLSWIESPAFKNSGHLILLVAETRSEINARIVGLPSVEAVEIQLPNTDERRHYVEFKIAQKPEQPIIFDTGIDAFVDLTAGLRLTSLRELLEASRRGGTKLTRKIILDEINASLKGDMGDQIKIIRPDHTLTSVIGSDKVKEILLAVKRRCEKLATAVSGVLISGPNGGGKTFTMQAFAGESERVVIVLSGLRSMWYGQTDIFFEKLLLRIKTYGNILILVDEAHTAFGSVHSEGTQDVEKRLAGNIIQMMSDKALLGKVLWGMMTSRPDELDPDVKSRCPIQIPLFDLEGDPRREYVVELCKRNKITVSDEDLLKIIDLTSYYSNRDFDFLVGEVLASDHGDVLKTLEFWQASRSIIRQRKFQSMIAAQHCSYPMLLPDRYKNAVGTPAFDQEVQDLAVSLGYKYQAAA